ncbi:FtsW/RodA/SpoVE family cell cycle protein [Fusobacterium sp. SYSU M8A802]
MSMIVENENLYNKRNQLNRQDKEEAIRRRKRIRNGGIVVILILLIIMSLLNMVSVKLEGVYLKGILKTIRNHCTYIGTGIGVFMFVSTRDYKKLKRKKMIGFLLLISILSLLAVVIGAKIPALKKYVPTINGAIGWIRIAGFSIQPAEMMKLPFIIILAKLLEKGEEEKYKSLGIIANVAGIVLIYLVLVMLEKDLGTTIHYIAIAITMLFMSRVSMKLIVGLSSLFIGVAGGFFYYVAFIGDKLTYGYRLRRVVSYLNGVLKNEYDLDIGYQVAQSLMAFGRGGILGEGYANGVQKYNYLPEANTDFILATFGEEFGFVGMLLLLFLFVLLFNNIKRTAMETTDYFGKYLAIGIGGYLITQVLINIYVALGMLPVFGIPMPIFSAGGTSIVTIFAAMGIILSINKQR